MSESTIICPSDTMAAPDRSHPVGSCTRKWLTLTFAVGISSFTGCQDLPNNLPLNLTEASSSNSGGDPGTNGTTSEGGSGAIPPMESTATDPDTTGTSDSPPYPPEEAIYVIRSSLDVNPNSCGLPDSLDTGVAQVGSDISQDCPNGEVFWIYAVEFNDIIGPDEPPLQDAQIDCFVSFIGTEYPAEGDGITMIANTVNNDFSWNEDTPFTDWIDNIQVEPVGQINIPAGPTEIVTFQLTDSDDKPSDERIELLLITNALAGTGTTLAFLPPLDSQGRAFVGSHSSPRAPFITCTSVE